MNENPTDADLDDVLSTCIAMLVASVRGDHDGASMAAQTADTTELLATMTGLAMSLGVKAYGAPERFLHVLQAREPGGSLPELDDL